MAVNRKPWKTGCAALLAISVGVVSAAEAGDSAIPQRIPDSYAHAGTLVSLGHGRQINLRCQGNGPQTVMLEAGSHADSTTWFKLQPLLAPFARVCAYDRAGYGFSSAGALPRNLDADVADLNELIRRAGLKTPLVLVGHSLGSNIVRRYADRYPADVSAMVLIDPPAQDIAAFAPAWAKDEDAMNVQRSAFIRQCEAGAEKHELASPPPELKSCLAGPNPLASAAVNAAIVAYKSKPAFWRTMLSELQDNVTVFRQPVSPSENHGSMPLIVLSAADTYADAPAHVRKALEAARDKTQTQIVATSTRGVRLQVENTSHDIQLDRPEIVAEAVARALRQTQTAN